MKPTLPTNYKDDILNTSVEGMRRYQMIYNSDNTVSFKDVTPYDQTGSDFGAGDINLTNQAVNESADAGKIIDDPDTAGATTQNGYIAGVQLFNHVNDSLRNVDVLASGVTTQATVTKNYKDYKFLYVAIGASNVAYAHFLIPTAIINNPTVTFLEYVHDSSNPTCVLNNFTETQFTVSINVTNYPVNVYGIK